MSQLPQSADVAKRSGPQRDSNLLHRTWYPRGSSPSAVGVSPAS